MYQSSSGLVHVSVQELLSASLQHLASGLDAENDPLLRRCGTVVPISGFTEWVSTSNPEISIGWDWHLQPTVRGTRWARVSLPRTNVVLDNALCRHLDWQTNLMLLATVVDALPWQECVAQSLTDDFRMNPKPCK